MKRTIATFLALLLATQTFAALPGRIQNEDVKSLSDIQSSVSTITGNLTSGNACIASPSSLSKLAVGQFIYDSTTSTKIPSGTTIAGLPGSCSAGQIQMSANAAGSSTGDTITFGGQSSQLINDTKIWMTATAPAQQLSSAITSGVIGGGSGGNGKNYLSNASFEGGTTSWTATTAVATVDTTNFTDGLQSALLTFTSSVGGLAQDVTPATQLSGVNLQATCYVNTTQSGIQVCPRSGGSDLSSASCTAVPNTGLWVPVTAYFGAPAANYTSIGVDVKATSSITGTVNVDQCYVGKAINLANVNFVGPWNSFTMNVTSSTGSNPTKATSPIIDSARWRQVGDSMEIHYDYQSTSTTGATIGTNIYLFALPSGYTIDTTKVSIPGSVTNYPVLGFMNESNINGFTATQLFGWPSAFDSSHLYMVGNDGVITGRCQVGGASAPNECSGVFTSAGFTLSFNAIVPITQFGSMTALATTDQSDFGWTLNTGVTPTNLGTITNNSFYEKRTGDTACYQGTFTDGTGNGSPAAIVLPAGKTIDSTKLSSASQINVVGTYFYGSSSTTALYATDVGAVLFYDGSTTDRVFVGFRHQAGGAIAKVAGSTVSSGLPNFAQFCVPITQWANTNRAPQLINSVISSSNGVEHIERLKIGSTGNSCTSSPCSITQSGSWITSVTRTSTGHYVANFTAGEFSSAPTCTCQVTNTNVDFCSLQNATTSSMDIFINTGVGGIDGAMDLICMGPK